MGGYIEAVRGVAIDLAGRVIVSGTHGITRFSPNGVLDTTFGTNGSLEPFPDGNIEPTEVILSDGTLVPTLASGGNLLRVTPGGQYDATFGRAVVSLGSLGVLTDPSVEVIRDAQTSLVQPDGSILVAQRFADGTFLQARIEGNGAATPSVSLSAFA